MRRRSERFASAGSGLARATGRLLGRTWGRSWGTVLAMATTLVACADVVPPDLEVRSELAGAYATCFEIVERETGRDLSSAELSGEDATSALRLARNRVIAAVNEASDTFRDTGTLEPITLPVLIAREPGDSGYAADALYDLECELDAGDLGASPTGPDREAPSGR